MTTAVELPVALPLEGASNVRDLGGWPTRDGRRVRRGMVFRSASLAGITEVDSAALWAAGVRVVADLRGVREAARLPSQRAWLPGIAWHALPIEPSIGASLRDIEATREATGEDAHRLMLMAYVAYALEWAHRYAALLALVEGAADGAVLFHCAAGKDRTGFGAALLLSALGVGCKAVMEDYMATNRLWRGDPELAARVPAAVADVFLRVHPELLQAAFAAIDERFGSLDGYLAMMGFGAERVGRLRDRLVE